MGIIPERKVFMNEYMENLDAFKDLIKRYTIADLRSMIYEVADTPSGGCCYPAVLTLFSLMEMLGRILDQRAKHERAFLCVFTRLGSQYTEVLGSRHYNYFRHGIAHTSLAKSGVKVKKSGDRVFHLSNDGNNIDIRILFEDFLTYFSVLFERELKDQKFTPQFAKNLSGIFSDLKLAWSNDPRFTEAAGGLDVSTNYTRTTVSGTNLSWPPLSDDLSRHLGSESSSNLHYLPLQRGVPNEHNEEGMGESRTPMPDADCA